MSKLQELHKYYKNHRYRCKQLMTAIASIFICTLFGILVFSPEKKSSAIENAALAAAEAMGEIVINSEEFGYVALCDYPEGKVAEDGYSLPVHGINTLIGTARLNLIAADLLKEPEISAFAKNDYRCILKAKQDLVKQIEKSLTPESKVEDKDGDLINMCQIAKQAYINSSGKELGKGYIKLSLGSLSGGDLTSIPLPVPEWSAPVDFAKAKDGYYLSYKNVPYKGTDFVFAGVGKKTKLVPADKWKKEIASLPIQMPSIVKVEYFASKEEGSDALQLACAQPGAKAKYINPGALTLSFPDGPVPEILRPMDLFKNEELNDPKKDEMEMFLAKGGDYPIEPGSSLQKQNTAIKNKSVSSLYRLAFYDWLRRAGPGVNLKSLVNMQQVQLEQPDPGHTIWSAPVKSGEVYQTLDPIANGIIHIFEIDQEGFIVYTSKIINPYPLHAISENQLYARSKAAITYSDVGSKTIFLPNNNDGGLVLTDRWDVYIRDQVRVPGSLKGGKHGGQPIAMPQLSKHASEPIVVPTSYVSTPSAMMLTTNNTNNNDTNGSSGYSPLISPQTDFGEKAHPAAPLVKPMPFGSGPRPFKFTSGTAVDVRFRRQVDVTNLSGYPNTGYIGIISDTN